MSIRVMSQVWDLDLPAFEKLVLLALADCANDEGLAWPSIATLRRKTNAGERTVQRSLRALANAGLLRRTEVPGKGCKYHLNPRHSGTPAAQAPAPESAKTPATVAPNPSGTVKTSKEARARELPLDWRPAEFGANTKSFAIVEGWTPDTMTHQLEQFTAHHRTRGNKFPDWQSAWSTWVLNSTKFNRSSNNGNRPANDEIQNPYVRSAMASQAARREAERAGAEFG